MSICSRPKVAAPMVGWISGISGSVATAPDDLRLALRAAKLYYLDGQTHAEIAEKLGVSRPTAGRLVARAKSRGLVRIEVMVPPNMRDDVHADEERALEERFGLIEAVVAGENVSRAAAALLMRRLAATDTMGFTWGPEVVDVARALTPGVASCQAVVQLDGAMSTAAYQTGADFILSRCADVLRAKTIRLPAPLYADPATVASMRRDSVMSRTLDAGRRADLMIFCAGIVSTSTTLFEASFLEGAVLEELISVGAVGEIGGRFFDEEGNSVHPDLQRRAISVPLDDVRSCAKTILLGGGPPKYRSTLGAIRGKLARLLVCDIDCARWLLAQ